MVGFFSRALVFRKKGRSAVVISLFLLAAAAAHADAIASTASKIVLGSASDSFPVGGSHIVYWNDLEGKASLDDARSHASDFQISRRETVTLGHRNGSVWLRFEAENQRPEKDTWFLEIAYPMLDSIEIYILNADDTVVYSARGGDHTPVVEREYSFQNYLFKVQLPAHEKRVFFLRVRSESTMQVPIFLHNDQGLVQSTTMENLGLGLYYGIAAVMILYNLFVFFSLRDVSYLFYVLYVSMYVGFQLAYNGLSTVHIWPGQMWWGDHNINIFIGCIYVFAVLFTRSFLHTRSYLPKFDKILLVSLFYGVAIVAVGFLGRYRIANILASAGTVILMLICIAAGVLALRAGYRPARFYLLGWILFLIGALLLGMKQFAILPSMFLTNYGSQIGSAVEMILLSLALADRINVMKTEKEEAREEAFKSQSLAIQTLEKADRLKDEFLSNVSHELNTPVTTILGYAELLKDGEVSPENQPEVLKQMHAESERLRSMLRLLMYTTKIDAGEIVPVPADLELDPLLAECVAETRGGTRGKVHSFRAEDSKWTLRADPELFRAAIVEILKNSVIHTPEGTITTIHASTNGSRRSIIFRNNGPSVPADALGKLNARFYRVDSSLTYKESGMGIGLFVASRLLECMGAELTHANIDGGFESRIKMPSES